MEQDIKQEDILPEEKTVARRVVQNIEEKEAVPNNYLEVKLDSVGVLSAPNSLHFRNYTMEEVNALASVSNETHVETLMKCLNDMVFEEFDCKQLHEKELEEVMVSIYAHYWSKFIELPYYRDPNADNLNTEENVKTTKVDISELKTDKLPSEFKEPIVLSANGIEVGFKLPRVGDGIFAKGFVEEKYFEQDRKYSDLKSKIVSNQKVNYKQFKKFEALTKQKELDFYRIIETTQLVSFNGKELETIEDKIEVYPKVSLNFWQAYQNTIVDKLSYGLNPEYTFMEADEDNEEFVEVTRGLLFQYLDFLPPLESKNDSEIDVRFGD